MSEITTKNKKKRHERISSHALAWYCYELPKYKKKGKLSYIDYRRFYVDMVQSYGKYRNPITGKIEK